MSTLPRAIETKGLTKTFGGLRAADALSIYFPSGVATGLIGPNGSGKTTLMNLLTGTLEPTEGSITISGKTFEVIEPDMLRDLKIARTFQDGRLVNQLSVEDNLLLAIASVGTRAGLGEIGIAGYGARVDAMLKKIHLEAHRGANAEDLSYGQRKLLELGRAIIQDADIYLLDEPFTGLFPAVVEQVAELLGELKRAGKTLVIIEHNIGLIRRLADNVIVLDHGQKLAAGVPEDVLKNKRVQEAYLGV
ncbi:MAG: ATP-binding cassette domain-containing protein [Alphaproteobacteria bacterium]|nr:ATP-binding cassette domain-containing protein [Alphaproteobacteria bacterium]